MKKCKECKREVPTKDWVYKYDLCTKCSYRKRRSEKNPEYADALKELEKLHKDDLITRLMQYKGNRANINMLFNQKNWQIRHFRSRLLKIRNQIDYLLKHPYSFDTSYQTEKHPRDGLGLAHRKGLLKKVRGKENESR